MTLIPLTYRNFVKNKISNTIKVKYKDSDESTYVYDNYLNSKSILNTVAYEDISEEEVNTSEIENVNKFFSFSENFNRENNAISGLSYIESKDEILKNSSISNDNIKDFNFRNKFKIQRVEQKFLPQSFELQKKNYVKNNLYRAYNEDYSLDFYNNLNYGFCNWNSINFFSQRFDNTNIKNHSNCIIWPNIKKDTYQYDFIQKSFCLSFYVNLRKNFNSHTDPECVFHIPDFLSLYIIRSFNNENHRIGISLGEKSKNNIKDDFDLTTSTEQVDNISQGLYITSDLNILNNRWYNLSFNFDKNADNSYNIQIFIDGVLSSEQTLNINKEFEDFNSYICLGNKPRYLEENNYEHVFYQLFTREFDKDISLGNIQNWSYENSIDVNSEEYKGNINFEANRSNNSESFHGEIHDIRIYNQTLSEDKININCLNTVQNLNSEIEDFGLVFYVPVHYLPLYVKKKGAFNASGDKLNLRYSCIFNPFLANTCGGLEVSSENYLMDFVKHSKPNVVIGGEQSTFVYSDNIPVSISSLISSTSDVNSIKKGKLVFSIYNENLNDENHANRSLNIDNNLSYRNLLLLPNDNGIQNVYFQIINSVLTNINENNKNIQKIDNNKLFNISVEDLFKDKNLLYNESWNLNDSSIDNTPSIEDNTDHTFNILLNNEEISFNLTKDKIFNISNFIFHDERITDIKEISSIDENTFTDKFSLYKNLYKPTESNPMLRNYKQDTSDTYLSSSNVYYTEKLEYSDEVISYLKLPIPYSVFNKDYDSVFTTIFDISSKLYNKNIKKNTFSIKDNNLTTTNSNVSLSFKENKNASVFRNDCLTKVAEWNYVGHVFYKEGIVSLNRPELCYFGKLDFECEFESDFSMFVHEINIPADVGLFDKTLNNTYDEDLRHDESAFNSEESFVYITDINLHDENLNIVARAKLARPAPKKKSDSILFRLKMDY